jgi:hypothetical protein
VEKFGMTQNVGTNDETVTGSKIFFSIFLTFQRETTILRGTLVENVKKSKINPQYSKIIKAFQTECSCIN